MKASVMLERDNQYVMCVAATPISVWLGGRVCWLLMFEWREKLKKWRIIWESGYSQLTSYIICLTVS
jgi:hypothetical protein